MIGDTGRSLAVVSGARRNYFSLEMTPGGVFLHLESASVNLSCGSTGISGLTLGVPDIEYPFDCQAGPRALRSHVTFLEAATIDLPFGTLAGIASVQGGVVVEAGPSGSLVLSGTMSGQPFSVRAYFEGTHDRRIKVRFRYPRIFGLTDRSWSAVTEVMMDAARSAGADDSGGIDILRTCLKPLTAGLGFKIPFMDDVAAGEIRVGNDRIRILFSRATAPALDDGNPSVATLSPGSPDPAGMLARLGSSAPGAEDVISFIEQGISRPVLWPEVLARAVALGGERPELVSALLAAVLVGAENPGWIGSQDLLVLCRRLLASSAAEGCRSETARCAALVAGVVDRFEPAAALDVLNEIRGGGFEGREVLEAVAMTFNRLGRHFDASTTRLRVLAMVPPGVAADTVRSMADRMDANGFGPQVSDWLSELGALAAAGRLGEASRAVNRVALILSASRDAVSSGPSAREGLRLLLADDPDDPELLELMLALAREKHEVAEVVELFTAAADRTSGRERCDLMLVAARAVHERFGLRRKSAELLEAGLAADPSCVEAADLLDSIYGTLGRSADRVELAARRLAGTTDPRARKAILSSMVDAAMDAGMPGPAADGIKALLRMDPSNLDYLRLGEAVFAAAGDQDALREVRDALEDLDNSGSSVEEALAAGDPGAAVARIRAALELEHRPPARVDLLLQAADLSLIAGAPPEAAAFLTAASALDPAAAAGAACRACAASAPAVPAELMEAVREAARAAMSGTEPDVTAGILLDCADRTAPRSMQVARELLETALPLAPGNLAVQMALAAVYEALGLKSEALALLGKE